MKEFISIIYLKDGMIYADRAASTVLDEDALSYIARLNNCGADGILLYDLSGDDASHEQALHMIADLCRESDLPIAATGNIKRLEDVKKLLYAGCAKTILDLSDEEHCTLLPEAAARFGADRIAAFITGKDMFLECLPLIDKNVSLLVCDGEKVSMKGIPLPVILISDSNSADRIGDLLSLDGVNGVGAVFDMELIETLPFLKQSYEELGMEVSSLKPAIAWNDLKLNSDGMIPVVVQDDATDAVLMVAYMNEEAYTETFKTGRMHYYSRSRSKLWLKGEESGHFQYVRSITADCDQDTLLARVKQVGVACHTGEYSCFHNEVADKKKIGGVLSIHLENPSSGSEGATFPPGGRFENVLEEVYATILDRKAHPKEGSYTNYLFDKGLDKILKKLGEETTEVVIASKNAEQKEVVYEIADVLYHTMVLMAEKGLTWDEILDELARRH